MTCWTDLTSAYSPPRRPLPFNFKKNREETMASVVDGRREFLRHTVATLAYRGGKVIRDAPEGFAIVRACPTCRSAMEILRHIGDLLAGALWLASGEHGWRHAAPQAWDWQGGLFLAGLRRRAESGG